MIRDMKRAIILSMAAFLFGFAVQAQNLTDDVIRPGDVLILKVSNAKRNSMLSKVIIG